MKGKYFTRFAAILIVIGIGSMPVLAEENLMDMTKTEISGQSSLLSEYLGTEDLWQAICKTGLECMTFLELQEGFVETLALGRMYGFIEDCFAELGIAWDPEERFWNFHIGSGLNEETYVSAELYGDTEKLLLSCQPFYDGVIGIESGSFLEQYTGSELENMLTELLGASEISDISDFDLVFYPEKKIDSDVQNPVEKVKSKFQRKIDKIVNNLTVEKKASDKVDIYYVTADTRDILEIGQVAYNEVIARGLDIGVIDYDDALNAVEELIRFMEEAERFLGETITVEFETENDLLLSMECSLVIENEVYTYDSEGERIRKTNEVVVSCETIFADPQNPMKDMDIKIDIVNRNEEDYTLSIGLALETKETDITSETVLTLEVQEGNELIYRGIPFVSSFDNKTGDFGVSVFIEELMTITLDGTFTEVIKGERFVYNMNNLSMTVEDETIGISGNVKVNAGIQNFSEPEDVVMICDSSRGELFTVMSEVMASVQNWMSEIEKEYMNSMRREGRY